MKKNNELQKGAIIIEASIVLPVFMFFMMTLLSIAQIAYLQARVSVALDRTAKQIAKYSHIYYATGLGDKLSGESGESSKYFDELAGYLDKVGEFINSDTLIRAADSLETTNLTKIVENEAIEAIATPILHKNILGTNNAKESDFEKFEKRFHIVKGSMNMDGTKFTNDKTEVFLEVHYKVEVIKLLSINKTFQLGHCSYCEAWRGVGEDGGSSSTGKSMGATSDEGVSTPKAEKDGSTEVTQTPEITKSVTGKAVTTPKVTKVPTARASTTPKVTKVPTARASTTPKVTKVPSVRVTTTPKVTKIPTARVTTTPKIPTAKATTTPRVTKIPTARATTTPKVTEMPSGGKDENGSSSEDDEESDSKKDDTSDADKKEPDETKEKKGGSYRDVKKTSDSTKFEVHHIPAKSVNGLKPDDGPAIKMEKADHYKTASWGRGGDEFRKRQKELIDQGKFREAVQMDIDDIHEKFGNKYDDAIAEMLKYIDQLEKEGKING